jgi:hypothetical protein
MLDVTTSSPATVVNGNFEGGTFTDPTTGQPQQPDGWTYLSFGGLSGLVQPHCEVGESHCYLDGAAGAYDAIS